MAAGLLLAACGCGSGGASGSNGAEPQSITLSYASANTTEKAYEALAKDYMAAHPGVTIKPTGSALKPYNQTLTTQMQAGNGPDVFYVNAGAGQAGTVGQLGKAKTAPALTDPAFTAVIPDGYERAATPTTASCTACRTRQAFTAIIYNDELAKQNGVNLTVDVHASRTSWPSARKVKATGKSIFGLAGSVPAEPGHPVDDDRLLHRLRPRPELEREADRRQDDLRGDAGLAPGAAVGHRPEQGRLLPGRRRRCRLRRPDQRRLPGQALRLLRAQRRGQVRSWTPPAAT